MSMYVCNVCVQDFKCMSINVCMYMYVCTECKYVQERNCVLYV